MATTHGVEIRRRDSWAATAASLLLGLALACRAADDTPHVAAPLVLDAPVAPATAVNAVNAVNAATSATSVNAPLAAAPNDTRSSPDAGAELAPRLLAPRLLAPDGTPLPQTRERPSADSPAFRLRLQQLVDAIASDDPDRALPAFFPRVAYEQVKAIREPGRDWQARLVRAFRRDIHAYHQQLGAEASGAELAGVSLNERAVRWMDPGAEGNRIGYYRVTRSRLRLRLRGGAERELALTSLISWRGAWYVVHLNGF